jgi:hypothetical protein
MKTTRSEVTDSTGFLPGRNNLDPWFHHYAERPPDCAPEVRARSPASRPEVVSPRMLRGALPRTSIDAMNGDAGPRPAPCNTAGQASLLRNRFRHALKAPRERDDTSSRRPPHALELVSSRPGDVFPRPGADGVGHLKSYR